MSRLANETFSHFAKIFLPLCIGFAIGISIAMERVFYIASLCLVVITIFSFLSYKRLFILFWIIVVTRPTINYLFAPSEITYFVGYDAIFLGGFTLILILFLLERRQISVSEPQLNKYFILWLACLFISIHSSKDFLDGFRRLFVAVSFFTIFVYIAELRNRKEIRKLMLAITLSSCVPLIVGLYNLAVNPVFRTLKGGLVHLRSEAILGSGYMLGVYLAIIALNTLSLCFIEKGKIRILAMMLFSMQVLLLITSGSRTAILSCLVGILTFLYFSKNLKRFFVLLPIALVIFYGFYSFSPDSVYRLIQSFDPSYYTPDYEDSTAWLRIMKYGLIWGLVVQKPFFGWGLANQQDVTVAFYNFYDLSSGFFVRLLEGGFVTMFFLMLLFVKIFIDGLKALKKTHNRDELTILSLMLATCISVLLISLGETIFLNGVKGFYFWCIFGIGYSILKEINRSCDKSS